MSPLLQMHSFPLDSPRHEFPISYAYCIPSLHSRPITSAGIHRYSLPRRSLTTTHESQMSLKTAHESLKSSENSFRVKSPRHVSPPRQNPRILRPESAVQGLSRARQFINIGLGFSHDIDTHRRDPSNRHPGGVGPRAPIRGISYDDRAGTKSKADK